MYIKTPPHKIKIIAWTGSCITITPLTTSTFIQKAGKGGMPLRRSITKSHPLEAWIEFEPGAPLEGPFSPPAKTAKEANTPKYKNKRGFQPQPPKTVDKTRAPRKKTEERTKIFFTCFIANPLTLKATQLKAISGTSALLLKALKIYKGIAFWIVNKINSPSHPKSVLRLSNHWWNGNPPIFNRILSLDTISRFSLGLEEIERIHSNNSIPPTLWIKKNLSPLTPRNRFDLNTNRGKNSNKFNSITTHTKTALVVLILQLIIKTNSLSIINRRNRGICPFTPG